MIRHFWIARVPLAAAVLVFLAAEAPVPVTAPRADETVPMSSAEAFVAWVAAKPERAERIRTFAHFLVQHRVGGIFPMHQLLRSESSWQRCGGEPFVIAPRAEWPHVVGTLRFIRDRVLPKAGALEVVSGYRTPEANSCAGGAPQSAHVGFWALDLVPVGPIERSEVIARLCAVHAAHGPRGHIGLGFYGGRRFHIDAKSYRRWGADHHGGSSPCNGAAG